MAHKFTDLTKLGGFPFTQNDLLHDRNGVYEAIAAHYKFASSSSEAILLQGSMTGSAWIVLDGEILPFVAPTPIPTPPSGESLYIVVNETKDPVVFDDLSVQYAANGIRTATVVSANTSTPPSAFLYNNTKRYSAVLGNSARQDWQLFWSGSNSSYDGEIYYKKNHLTNMLQLRGSFTVKSAVLHPAAYNSIGGVSLPVDCRPATVAPFLCHYRYHVSELLEASGKDYIAQINGEVRADGVISIGFRRPLSPTTSYNLTVNTLIPLD